MMQRGSYSNADDVLSALKKTKTGGGAGSVPKNSTSSGSGLLNCVRTLPALESTTRYCTRKTALENAFGSGESDCFVSILSSDGGEFMFSKRDYEYNSNRDGGLIRSSSADVGVSLLSVSVSELRNRLNEAETNSLVGKGLGENEGSNNAGEKRTSPDSVRKPIVNESRISEVPVVEDLWVKKYAPKNFSELLSAERLNRNVLRYMKSWDLYVFNKKGIRSMDIDEQGGNSFKNVHGENGGGNVGLASSDKKDDERPQQKVILLCGSQGLGKSTLANIAAEHCGYRPLVVGAGDDRTPEALKDVFSRAMLGNTLSRDNKPNCIILDEIDSIDSKASTDTIIKIVNQPLKGSQQGRGGGEGKTDGYPSLSRPLICICNDQFAPSLRELRQHCAIYTLRPIEAPRLASRLKVICADEDITISSSSMSTLTSSSRGDIRSAINSLQFAFARSSLSSLSSTSTPIGGGSVSSTNGEHQHTSRAFDGVKEQHSGIFDIWSKVYQHDGQWSHNTAVKAAIIGGTVQDKPNTEGPTSPVMQIFEWTSDYCDPSLVLNGLFENLGNVPYLDPTLARTEHASEWLSYGDSMIFRGQAYLPVVASALHVFCASGNTDHVKLDWPRKGKENSYLLSKNENILRSLRTGDVGHHAIQSASSLKQVSLDLLCPLLDILSPSVRVDIGSSLLTETEREDIERTAEIMAHLGIRYHQNRHLHSKRGESLHLGDVDSSESLFDPPFDLLTAYKATAKEDAEAKKLFKPRGRPSFSSSVEVMQLLSAELKNKIIHRRVQVSEGGTHVARGIASKELAATTQSGTNNKRKFLDVASPHFELSASSKVGKALLVAQGKNVDDRQVKDTKRVKLDTRFKYNQGFSSAVRRAVHIAEFCI